MFTPGTTEAGARALIPLAYQACGARAEGQSDLQAAQIIFANKGVDMLGVTFSSVASEQSAALDIVEAATLAYCPTYNNGNW